MASCTPCGLSDKQMKELTFFYYHAASSCDIVTENLLENMVGETITISIRNLAIPNSYNSITGVVKDNRDGQVLVTRCDGHDYYGKKITGERWFKISELYLYHPSIYAFFSVTDPEIY